MPSHKSDCTKLMPWSFRCSWGKLEHLSGQLLGFMMRHWSSGEICSPPSFRVSLTAHLQYRSRPSRRRCLSAVHLTFGSCDLLVGCFACLSAHIFPSFSLPGRVCVAVPPLSEYRLEGFVASSSQTSLSFCLIVAHSARLASQLSDPWIGAG